MEATAMSLADVQQRLVLTKIEKSAAESNTLRMRRVIQRCCHVQASRVDLTGSMRRGTAVSGGEFDVNMRVELREQDWGSLNLLKQQARLQLSSEGVRVLQEGQHILKLIVIVGAVKLPVDLVFTSAKSAGSKQQLESSHFDADQAKWNDHTLAFRAYYSLQNDDKLVAEYERLSAEGHHIRELILLTKFWKKQMLEKLEKAGATQDANRLRWVKSMHLELACLAATQELAKGQGFHMSFGRVLTLLARGLNNSDLAGQLFMEQSYLGLREAERNLLKAQARNSLRKTGFMCPGKDDSQDLFLFLRPSEIRFTQQKCSPTFSDRHGHGDVSIGETAKRILSGEIHKKDTPMIRIVEDDSAGGKVYSVDNRRLAVFRLLEMTGHAKVVKVQVLAMGDLHKGEWKKKHSTKTDGWVITVSGPEGYAIGRDRQSTTYPLPVGSFSQSLSNTSLSLDELESDDESASLPSNDTRSNIKVDNAGATRANADHSKPLATGAERIVYKAVYIDGSRKGDSCVKKVFKTGAVYRDDAFAKDLEVVARAQTFLSKFGEDLHVRKKLRHQLHLNRPSVWTHLSESDPHKSLIEPYIEGEYKNFNSNTGW
ncbi:unnamed protein product [Symbiodinium necroappetens]|uniref:Alpha-type protein kinase domain-containing protein n=1 Tax=Symbiodinium necroappetens TaxID=1628268 RepID=A0A812UX50_9DINO|nr:unnamed protein product [Symbiodinium necroappetens]